MANKIRTSPVFNENPSVPLYLQVEATLKEMIEDTTFSLGDQIPSERELSEQLGVSRMTVRHAIQNLTDHGLLERRSTNGTYVSQPQVMRGMGKEKVMGLTQLLLKEGVMAGSKLLSFEVTRAPLKVAEKLKIRLGAQVVILRRLRLANGEPFCVETSYIPYDLVPDLSIEDFSTPNSSLYVIMQDRYNIKLDKNNETLKISFATLEEAEQLEIQEGDPVILLRSVVMDDNNRCVEYLKSVNHPSRVIFHSIAKL
ncbi:MAG: GntR family transcriptional regulator [Anaerolineaceae bacterium]